MLQILVRMLALASGMILLAACGQKGNLYLPTEPAAAQRASLPQAVTTSIRATLPLPAASTVTAPDAPAAHPGNDKH